MRGADGKLIQVTGPHLCAGMVIRGGIVVETAPILKRYKGLTEARALELCGQRSLKWKVVG